MTKFDVDLFVIGGGSGGVRAARIAAGHGARVMVAEEYRFGGTCVIRGCVPKKLMMLASLVSTEIKGAAGFGWSVSDASFDWSTLIANKDVEIARLESIYASNLEKAGVGLARARAVLEDANTVRLSTGERITAKYIIIATGGVPNHGASIPGIEHVISSNEVFYLPNRPNRIVIQGGGYIALEFASIFNGLGSNVTLVYRGDNILRGFDEDVRDHVRREVERAGINILTLCTIDRVERQDGVLVSHLSNGSRVESDEVMFAIGRHPNVAGLGLGKAGVSLNPQNGGIGVDHHCRTNVPHIFAVGDVTHRMNLTPVAIREGHAVADRLFAGKSVTVDYESIPTAVFSVPQIGAVGLTEEVALSRYERVDIFKAEFHSLKARMSKSEGRVLMKLVVEAESDRVLGCHIVGPEAAELTQLAAVAIKMGAKKADFDATIALHPTSAEELVTMRTPTARHGLRAAAE